MDTCNDLSLLSRLLVRLLAAAGVADLVVSPGSRSTPYLSAALEERCLRVHGVVDERSAAYLALGMCRASNRPVALLCTSGTAAANYLPAVVEARLTETPLVLLTADRPLSLQHCAAPQTIDQTRLFGTHVVGATSLSVPFGGQAELPRLRRQILSTLAISVGEPRGPVHLNLHTPKPLELASATHPEVARAGARLEELCAIAPLLPSSPVPLADEAVDRLYRYTAREEHGLIVCGFEPNRFALDPVALAQFARATGYPVLLDAAHPLRFDCPDDLRPHVVAPFESLLQLDSWRELYSPRLVIQIGRPLTSSAFESWLDSMNRSSPVSVALLSRSGWSDPSGHAELIGKGDVNDALRRTAAALGENRPQSDWARTWRDGANVVAECVDELADVPERHSGMPELHAVHATLSTLSDGTRLVIGNSLPIREVDLLASLDGRKLRAESLRGASGIDGVISTAVGFAIADPRPTTLLIGDISFLHDVGGLWATTHLRSPFAIVVLNNGGGRIFEQLPIAEAVTPNELTLWTTPQQLDLSGAATLYGLRHVRVNGRAQLEAVLRDAVTSSTTTLIEVLVDGQSARTQRAELRQRVADRLTRAGLLSKSEPA